ncbi:stretch-activated Ca2+-permeable channel component-domain-containing protein [Hypoxylon sp. NC1633]|nr:stretch-activated Ca2+-permeable channel component-domain-containing protein [Hypoxylon sp. NC1633]
MQLSPLQSRLAASVIASCLLLVLYIFLFSPQFALAAELDPVFTDHNVREWDYERQDGLGSPQELDLRSPTYDPEFDLFDRSIIGRATDNVVSLTNNVVEKSNIAPGGSMTFVLTASSVANRAAQDPNESRELRRRLNGSLDPATDDSGDEEDMTVSLELDRRQQASKTLWISANTCEQPWPISPSKTTTPPPQLTLYVSTSSENTSPGPSQNEKNQKTITFNEGAVMFNTSVNRDVYLSIVAPNVSSDVFDTTKQYNFELIVSTDRYYYSYTDQNDTELIWVDSDAAAALLQTSNLTESSDQVLTTTPYVMFAQNQDNAIINGMRNSYCGLLSYAQVRNLDDGSTGAITMGLKQGGDKNLTRQQFYVTGLNASSNYLGILARPPVTSAQKRQDDSSTIGGGVVFQPTNFSTKPEGACTFVFNLTLCDETQYAVPGNLKNFPNGTALAAFYDNYTQTMWNNFDKVLQQVPCETDSIAKYSLVRDCDDCKTAYKNWLCSVAVPRCEDFSTPYRDFLQMRNIGAPFPNGTTLPHNMTDAHNNSLFDLKAFNSSRNPSIDEVVQPGPYKEVLPCEDLCYDLVRSCPASLGFSCPRPDSPFGFNTSYGKQTTGLSCNYPGSAHYPSGASMLPVSSLGLAGVLLLTLLL